MPIESKHPAQVSESPNDQPHSRVVLASPPPTEYKPAAQVSESPNDQTHSLARRASITSARRFLARSPIRKNSNPPHPRLNSRESSYAPRRPSAFRFPTFPIRLPNCEQARRAESQ